MKSELRFYLVVGQTQRAYRNFDVESTSKFRRQFFNAFSTPNKRPSKYRRRFDIELEVSTSKQRRNFDVEKALKNVRTLRDARRKSVEILTFDVDSTSIFQWFCIRRRKNVEKALKIDVEISTSNRLGRRNFDCAR